MWQDVDDTRNLLRCADEKSELGELTAECYAPLEPKAGFPYGPLSCTSMLSESCPDRGCQATVEGERDAQ
jgi:hypothetical protein